MWPHYEKEGTCPSTAERKKRHIGHYGGSWFGKLSKYIKGKIGKGKKGKKYNCDSWDDDFDITDVKCSDCKKKEEEEDVSKKFVLDFL